MGLGFAAGVCVLVCINVVLYMCLHVCMYDGLPQPPIAEPVFFFVEQFVQWESVGLGFAAGVHVLVCINAVLYVASCMYA